MLTSVDTYHAAFPPSLVQQTNPICQLEVMVAVKVWVPQLVHHFVHFYCDNAIAVVIFQAGKCKDAFLQAYAQDVCLMCALWDITLAVSHIPGAQLRDTADALSSWHLSKVYRDRVTSLVQVKSITSTQSQITSSNCLTVSNASFQIMTFCCISYNGSLNA